MWIIQFLDGEEGGSAQWRDIRSARFESRDDARKHVRAFRETDDEWCLYSYRVVEEGSDAYFAQPTDAGEY